MQDMIHIKIAGSDEITADHGIRLYEIARAYPRLTAFPILVARVNNELLELNARLLRDCEIELLDITNSHGFRVYQRTAAFIMICAIYDALSEDVSVAIEHSINKNLVCELTGPGKEPIRLTTTMVDRITSRMKEMIEDDILINKVTMTLAEGVRLCEENKAWDKVDALKFRRTSSVNFYRLNGYYDYFYGPMARSTGQIHEFKLVKSGNSLLLCFPSTADPSVVNEVPKAEKVTAVFREAKNWAGILKAETVGSLNDIICGGGIGEFVRTNEALHEKRVARLADTIASRKRRLVMIAGPTSSGKTTFANRLAIQLRAGGLRPYIVSLDDYYIDRSQAPIDIYGEPDFEHPDAIDSVRVNEDAAKLLSGGTVELPTFDFKTGMRSQNGRPVTMGQDDVLIIEGIHGLNPRICDGIPEEEKFRIFISVFTTLNIDDHNRIATTDTRLIRRLVRDHLFRNFGALKTIKIWPSVGRGEQRYVFLYQESADAIFNSSLVYELCVLKQYAEPLLFNISQSSPEYMEARRLIKFLDSFLCVSDSEVPSNSILREFIGSR